jgi:signal transduction histidine kinase
MLSLVVLGSYYFMDDFFISYNKNLIKEEVEKYLNDGTLGNEESNKKLSMNTGSILYIYDKNNDLTWSNNSMDLNSQLSDKQLMDLREKSVSGNIEFILFKADSLAESKLVSPLEFDNGKLLIIVKQMGILHEVREIFLQFLIIITAMVYILAFIAIFISANRIARPIINLKDATEKIADMQFDIVLDEKGQDEINSLAVSINTMARKLQLNIETINLTNFQLERELSKEKNLESMRRRFVSDVSHELKNPISMIIAYAEGLIRKIPKTEDNKNRYYQVIFEEGNKVNDLISDLLDLSSYQSGTFTMHKEVVNLTELVSNALERYDDIGRTKKVNVFFDKSQNIEVYGDPMRLGQVILNLLSNAIKNVDDNGRIHITAEKYGDKSKLTIRNTGNLIPEKEFENIWESFYQVDTNTEGKGLGLAITKSIVDLHKGSIRVYIQDEMNCFEVII